ncbi:hypothetical protein [Streptomyces sp. ISL-100]|uniref:hypothetical protein n=1 Tax=Streptomyces sp. ISL-100 TaxID=2819173 RepID=UPI001BE70861|nr:hypothetical protein [Streptomyces sp. ISL-100]MBT2400647.1 hypothetical protein [Streptomyces sp. ISL-100]
MEETEPTYYTCTCRTEGCPANGVPCNAPLYPNATEPTWRAQCGHCGKNITDMHPTA